jgi:O-acetylserine/cysteine efflux transporter
VPRRDALLAAAVAAVWGINFVVIHVGLRSWPPLLFAALRFTVTAFPAVLFVRRPRGTDWRLVVGVGLFMSAGQFGFLFVGIDRGVPAGLASLVLQLQAAFTAGFAVLLLGERPDRRRLAGAALAFAGIGVIALDRTGGTGGVPLGALLLVVVAAASWGLGNICSRVARAPDALALLVWSSLVPPVPLAVASLALEGRHAAPDAFAHLEAAGIGALAYVVGASTFFGYTTWNALLRRHPATAVAPFTLLVPVVGITAAWVALGERPTARELLGAAIVLAGLARTVTAGRVGIEGEDRETPCGSASEPSGWRVLDPHPDPADAPRWRTGRSTTFDHSP